MFLDDVVKLIESEEQGYTVISWHARYLWDHLKSKVKTEKEAKQLGKFMRTAHHYFLELFYIISSESYKDFLLQYLNPQFAYYERIEFEDLDNSTFEYTRMTKQKGTKTQYHNNAARYIRIAFESLDHYHEKKNRNIMPLDINCSDELRSLLLQLKQDEHHNPKLRILMNSAFREDDKKTREEIIKSALVESELNPYLNDNIDRTIREILQLVAKRLIAIW
jgi:hypothetical protein